jgi:hypothetical protein
MSKYGKLTESVREKLGIKDKIEHIDLNDELTIISSFIQDDLHIAAQESTPIVSKKLIAQAKLISQHMALRQFDKANVLLADLIAQMSEYDEVNQAKKSAEERIKRYTDIFAIEDKRRANSNELIHKNKVLAYVNECFQLIAKELSNDRAKLLRIANGFREISRRNDMFSTRSVSENDNTYGLINSYEGSRNNSIQTEPGPNSLPATESEVTDI